MKRPERLLRQKIGRAMVEEGGLGPAGNLLDQ